ncbi:MAG: hypothetical protein IJO67_05505 [Clostridia bacterium]|nr:hypothetical protein [Clostridia bacterium]
MKKGYVCVRTPETSYFCQYLTKQGAEEVIVDQGENELLPGLLDSMKPGDSLHVIALHHLSKNLTKLKEILETIHQKQIPLFVGGQYIDFENVYDRMELEKYFIVCRQAREEIKANLDAAKAIRERMKKDRAGE